MFVNLQTWPTCFIVFCLGSPGFSVLQVSAPNFLLDALEGAGVQDLRCKSFANASTASSLSRSRTGEEKKVRKGDSVKHFHLKTWNHRQPIFWYFVFRYILFSYFGCLEEKLRQMLVFHSWNMRYIMFLLAENRACSRATFSIGGVWFFGSDTNYSVCHRLLSWPLDPLWHQERPHRSVLHELQKFLHRRPRLRVRRRPKRGRFRLVRGWWPGDGRVVRLKARVFWWGGRYGEKEEFIHKKEPDKENMCVNKLINYRYIYTYGIQYLLFFGR